MLHQGECGAPNETTFVSTPRPPLPVTGASEALLPIGLLAGGATLAGLTAIIIATVRRRHGSATAAPTAA